MPRLSIITINYNNRTGLERTLQSVLSQSFTDYEYIVVDGGSNDGSVDVIRNSEKMIHKWISEKDKGIYNAMNKGVALASGEYLLFLNSGDRLCNEHVLRRVFSAGSTADILYGDLMVDWGNGKVTHERMHRRIGLYEMFTDTVWHPAAFIRRKLFEEYGNYDETLQIVADYEFFFRCIIAKGASTHYLGFPVSVFGFDGLSSEPANKVREQEERKIVAGRYMTSEEIAEMDKKREAEVAKKRTWYYRIMNKLKK